MCIVHAWTVCSCIRRDTSKRDRHKDRHGAVAGNGRKRALPQCSGCQTQLSDSAAGVSGPYPWAMHMTTYTPMHAAALPVSIMPLFTAVLTAADPTYAMHDAASLHPHKHSPSISGLSYLAQLLTCGCEVQAITLSLADTHNSTGLRLPLRVFFPMRVQGCTMHDFCYTCMEAAWAKRGHPTDLPCLAPGCKAMIPFAPRTRQAGGGGDKHAFGHTLHGAASPHVIWQPAGHHHTGNARWLLPLRLWGWLCLCPGSWSSLCPWPQAAGGDEDCKQHWFACGCAEESEDLLARARWAVHARWRACARATWRAHTERTRS